MLVPHLRVVCFVVVVFIGFVLAQDVCDAGADACKHDGGCLCPQCENTLQCNICGNQNDRNGPIMTCNAYNATFDDLTPGSTVSDYQNQTYTEFVVVARTPSDKIVPASRRNYIRSTTGTGQLTFNSGQNYYGDNIGQLFYFDYACGRPASGAKKSTSSPLAVACTVTVVANCRDYTYNYYEALTFDYNQTFAYDPCGKKVAPMALGFFNDSDVNVVKDPYEEYYTYKPSSCFSYNFTAVQSNGNPAVLYLDNVVVNGWSSVFG